LGGKSVAEIRHEESADQQRRQAGQKEKRKMNPWELALFPNESIGRDVVTGAHETTCIDLQRLQVFAWFEADCLSWWDIHFRSRAGVPPYARLTGLDGEDAKAAQFNPIVRFEGVFHAVKDSIDGLFGFCFTNARALDDLIDKIKFDHWQPPDSLSTFGPATAISFSNKYF